MTGDNVSRASRKRPSSSPNRRLANCYNCGAPRSEAACVYCGTSYVTEPERLAYYATWQQAMMPQQYRGPATGLTAGLHAMQRLVGWGW